MGKRTEKDGKQEIVLSIWNASFVVNKKEKRIWAIAFGAMDVTPSSPEIDVLRIIKSCSKNNRIIINNMIGGRRKAQIITKCKII